MKKHNKLNWDLRKNPDITEKFILNYPYRKWDIEYLIKNNKITDFNALSKFKYITQKIIEKYSDKPWDWEWIIENTNINIEKYVPIDLIEKYKNKWNYYLLSINPNITEKFILRYPYQYWNIEYLIDNNKITDFNSLSKFKYINLSIIDKYSDKPWDWEWIINNNNIDIENYISNILFKIYKNEYNTEEFILKYPHKNWDIKYLINNNIIIDFKSLTKFKNIDQYIIDKYPDKSWDWEWLINNSDIYVEKYISIELIEKYKNKWDYYQLSKNPNLTKDFILNHSYKKWNIIYLINNNKIFDFNSLSKFININQYIIDSYQDKSWDWGWLIENTDIHVEKYISFNLIEKYCNILNYYYLSYNINITEDFILKYPDENWDIEYLINTDKITDFKLLSRFKNITQKIINDYPDKQWD